MHRVVPDGLPRNLSPLALFNVEPCQCIIYFYKKRKANLQVGVGHGGGDASPERNEEDAIDDVELFQDTGHAGGCELRCGREVSQ